MSASGKLVKGIRARNREAMARALHKGADPNYSGKLTQWKTPLIWAVKQQFLAGVMLLLSMKETQVDKSEESSGMTPLHYACQHAHLEIVVALIKHRANCEARSTRGLTPMDMARSSEGIQRSNVIRVLEKAIHRRKSKSSRSKSRVKDNASESSSSRPRRSFDTVKMADVQRIMEEVRRLTEENGQLKRELSKSHQREKERLQELKRLTETLYSPSLEVTDDVNVATLARQRSDDSYRLGSPQIVTSSSSFVDEETATNPPLPSIVPTMTTRRSNESSESMTLEQDNDPEDWNELKTRVSPPPGPPLPTRMPLMHQSSSALQLRRSEPRAMARRSIVIKKKRKKARDAQTPDSCQVPSFQARTPQLCRNNKQTTSQSAFALLPSLHRPLNREEGVDSYQVCSQQDSADMCSAQDMQRAMFDMQMQVQQMQSQIHLMSASMPVAMKPLRRRTSHDETRFRSKKRRKSPSKRQKKRRSLPKDIDAEYAKYRRRGVTAACDLVTQRLAPSHTNLACAEIASAQPDTPRAHRNIPSRRNSRQYIIHHAARLSLSTSASQDSEDDSGTEYGSSTSVTGSSDLSVSDERRMHNRTMSHESFTADEFERKALVAERQPKRHSDDSIRALGDEIGAMSRASSRHSSSSKRSTIVSLSSRRDSSRESGPWDLFLLNDRRPSGKYEVPKTSDPPRRRSKKKHKRIKKRSHRKTHSRSDEMYKIRGRHSGHLRRASSLSNVDRNAKYIVVRMDGDAEGEGETETETGVGFAEMEEGSQSWSASDSEPEKYMRSHQRSKRVRFETRESTGTDTSSRNSSVSSVSSIGSIARRSGRRTSVRLPPAAFTFSNQAMHSRLSMRNEQRKQAQGRHRQEGIVSPREGFGDTLFGFANSTTNT